MPKFLKQVLKNKLTLNNDPPWMDYRKSLSKTNYEITNFKLQNHFDRKNKRNNLKGLKKKLQIKFGQ